LAVAALLGCGAISGGLLGCGGDDDDGNGGGGSDQQAISEDADAKAGARTAQTALEVYFTERASYEGATPETLAQIDPTLSDYELTINAAAEMYDLTVESTTGNTFTITRDAAGTVTLSCETEGEGECPDGGQW
jgi:hypothetical protein